MPSIRLKPLSPSDLQTVYDIQCRAFKKEFHEPVSLFEKIYNLYPPGCFLIEHNGQIVGYLFTNPAHLNGDHFEKKKAALSGDEDALYIHDLCIDPAYHGQGIAHQVCLQMEDFARQKNFDHMIGIAIEGVQQFWQKLGYEMLRPYTYDGQPAMFMHKALKPN